MYVYVCVCLCVCAYDNPQGRWGHLDSTPKTSQSIRSRQRPKCARSLRCVCGSEGEGEKHREREMFGLHCLRDYLHGLLD